MISLTEHLQLFALGLARGRTVIHQAQQALTSRHRDAIVGARERCVSARRELDREPKEARG